MLTNHAMSRNSLCVARSITTTLQGLGNCLSDKDYVKLVGSKPKVPEDYSAGDILQSCTTGANTGLPEVSILLGRSADSTSMCIRCGLGR